MTTARRIQRHRTLSRLISLTSHGRSWLALRVWADALADPTFVDGLRAGRADLEAGRWYSMTRVGDRLIFEPNYDWPADGPPPTHREPLVESLG